MTLCEPAMSEAVVLEPAGPGGLLESSCAASLDDGIVDTAKYVHTNRHNKINPRRSQDNRLHKANPTVYCE